MKKRRRDTRKEPRARQTVYVFNVRALDDTVHRRLVAAAKEDNRTVASELMMLLDLRERWHELNVPGHPLALPLPEVIA